MFDRPPLLEEPFAQTLSGKTFLIHLLYIQDIVKEQSPGKEKYEVDVTGCSKQPPRTTGSGLVFRLSRSVQSAITRANLLRMQAETLLPTEAFGHSKLLHRDAEKFLCAQSLYT